MFLQMFVCSQREGVSPGDRPPITLRTMTVQGRGLCMMSLPALLVGPMFLLGQYCWGGLFAQRGSFPIQTGSLSGVGLCPLGFLSRGVCVQWVSVRETPHMVAGGWHASYWNVFLLYITTRKHSSRMRTDHAVTRANSERVAMRPIVVGQTAVKTLPSPCGR